MATRFTITDEGLAKMRDEAEKALMHNRWFYADGETVLALLERLKVAELRKEQE